MADDNSKKILDYVLASHSPVINGTIHHMREKFPHLKEHDFGDLYEAATNAAILAVKDHDPSFGTKLSTFMSQKIANSLKQKFKPKDVAATDIDLARRTKVAQPDVTRVHGLTPSTSRGAIEAAGGSVGEEGSSSGVSIIRNQAAEFAAKNPHIKSELERKVKRFEQQQAKKQPTVEETTPPPPKPAVQKPTMIVRRKQIESSLQPEHLDRMKRIDGKKVTE